MILGVVFIMAFQTQDEISTGNEEVAAVVSLVVNSAYAATSAARQVERPALPNRKET